MIQRKQPISSCSSLHYEILPPCGPESPCEELGGAIDVEGSGATTLAQIKINMKMNPIKLSARKGHLALTSAPSMKGRTTTWRPPDSGPSDHVKM